MEIFQNYFGNIFFTVKGRNLKDVCVFVFMGGRWRKGVARTDGICETEGAGCFDAATDVLDRSTRITYEPRAIVDILEKATCEHFEARDDAFAREILDALYRTRRGNLHLERALAKAEPQRFRHERLHL